jgi:hypothetical protein
VSYWRQTVRARPQTTRKSKAEPYGFDADVLQLFVSAWF